MYEPHIVYSQYAGHATEICHEEIKKGAEVIVAVGGDGSVNDVAKGVTGSSVTMGIIPAGSGNGLANHLKIPLLWRSAIDVINRGKVKKIDTGLINDRLFVSIAGIGFDGRIAKRFETSKFRGFVSYLKLVAEEYPKYRPKKYKIIIENEVIHTRALFIAFANSDQFGFRASIAPDARVDDGLLDVIIAQKPAIIELPLLASLLYWRKIELSKHIVAYKATSLEIQTAKSRWVNLDGNPVKLGKKLHVKINPRSLNILVP